MEDNRINIVWLKRDLRTQDHKPLLEAEKAMEEYIIIYLIEPRLMSSPDASLRHLQFCYHAIMDMNKSLIKKGRQVTVLYGEAEDIFKYLSDLYTIKKVFSYQETGTRRTWDRDKEVAKLFKLKRISWLQFARDGIQRGIKNRKDWDKQWLNCVRAPMIKNSYSASNITLDLGHKLPEDLASKLDEYPDVFLKAGESEGKKLLESFCVSRGVNYFKHISKPFQSRTSCSRISPYLAWGCLSIKQVYQYVNNHGCSQQHKRAYSQFLTRLH